MRRFGVVVLVLAGVWVLTQALLLLSFPLALLTQGGHDGGYPAGWMFFLALLPVVGALVFGDVLIAGRRRLAQRWFEDGGPEVRLSGVSLLRAGLLIIGIGMIAQAIPRLLQSIAAPFVYSAWDSSSSVRDNVLTEAPQFATGACGLVLG